MSISSVNIGDRSDANLGDILPELLTRLKTASSSVDFGRSDLARALDTTPRTVSRWLGGETAPRGDVRERILEVLHVFDQLSKVLNPQAAHDWLLSPNEMLGHEKPIDLLKQGEYRRVLGAVEALAEGVFV